MASGDMYSTKGKSGLVAFAGDEPLKYYLGLPRVNGYGSGTTAAQVAASWDGRGKTVVVTGASAGLGQESAKVLAARGAEVVLAVRNPARADKAVAHIRAEVPDARLVVMSLDLNSMASVKKFADEFLATGKPLHILLCNAGIMALPNFIASEDGYEGQWATNHLGHHLLIQLLLPRLLDTAKRGGQEGRIVLLSSYGHSMAGNKVENVAARLTKQALSSPAKYTPFGAYGISKLSNILEARYLNFEVLKGQPVVAAAVHPGYIFSTDLGVHMLPGVRPAWLRRFLLRTVSERIGRVIGKSIPQGAATQVFVATAPAGKVVGGEYYSDCNIETSSVPSHSKLLAKQLWDLSEELCKPHLTK